MIGGPHLEVPGAIFIVMGVAFIVFRGMIANWFNALSKRIWNSEKAKQLQGANFGVEMKPSMAVALGVAWILSGIIMLFVV
ncbi:MAG: hypothetical protein WCI03_13455 [bacterium]